MKIKLKLYFPLALMLFIVIVFGQINVLASGLSRLSQSNVIIDTLENFDDGEVLLQSYSDEDINPNMWSLDNTITYNNSSYSLKLFGNTWKLEVRYLLILKKWQRFKVLE